jgi:hypothetical protein
MQPSRQVFEEEHPRCEGCGGDSREHRSAWAQAVAEVIEARATGVGRAGAGNAARASACVGAGRVAPQRCPGAVGYGGGSTGQQRNTEAMSTAAKARFMAVPLGRSPLVPRAGVASCKKGTAS